MTAIEQEPPAQSPAADTAAEVDDDELSAGDFESVRDGAEDAGEQAMETEASEEPESKEGEETSEEAAPVPAAEQEANTPAPKPKKAKKAKTKADALAEQEATAAQKKAMQAKTLKTTTAKKKKSTSLLGGKRHAHFGSKTFEYKLAKNEAKRLCYRAGVVKTTKSVRAVLQRVLQSQIEEIMERAHIYRDHRRARTIKPSDVLRALADMGRTVYC